MEHKNKDRIQDKIHHSADENREHSHVTKSLTVNKRIQSKRDHHRRRSRQIDQQIIPGITKSSIAGSESIENGLMEKISHSHENSAGNQKHGKGISHKLLRFITIAPSHLHGTERASSITEQIGKSRDQRDNRKADSYSRKRHSSHIGYSADIHTVHNVV